MTEATAVTLPENVKPARYDLTLTPDLVSFTFSGNESIDIAILEPTSEIVLNCAEIDIQSSSLSMGGETQIPTETVFDENAETVTFEIGSELTAGQAT